MSKQQVEILLICGSPRAHTSEALLALLEQGIRDTGARCRRFLLSEKHIAPCIGCGWCEKTGRCILAEEGSERYTADDYAELLEALAYADALAIVSPLFFAGPPAQLKALFDRMQPFWARRYVLGEEPLAKRPAQIFILGGGGDAHGYEPLVTIARSALAVAGFTVEKVQNFVGFRHAQDVAPLPSAEEAESIAFGELAHLRKAAATQREFTQRAVAAGGAFARFVTKSMVKQELQAELQQVEAEIAELRADGPTAAPHSTSAASEGFGFEDGHAPIVNQVDSEFEALKQTARAAKSGQAARPSQAKQAELDAVIEEAVAAVTEDASADTDAASPARARPASEASKGDALTDTAPTSLKE
ncbi:MAG: flavodoxin family protein [Coriobacteriales bacterium]|jgi:multimeric flavodoxin WrbA|nr:flavodoxin family protein [Coriobacteriales bacterium]